MGYPYTVEVPGATKEGTIPVICLPHRADRALVQRQDQGIGRAPIGGKGTRGALAFVRSCKAPLI